MIKFKIKNGKLALLALIFFCFFISLGIWQLSRAHQKKLLLLSFQERTKHLPISAKKLTQQKDVRFYRGNFEGYFDNQHSFLLDNKIFHKQIGYEVYTPFKIKGLNIAILVDRGFVPIMKSRQQIPFIHEIKGNTTISGMLNLPPTYVTFGKIADTHELNHTLVIEYVNLIELEQFTRYPLFPYLLTLEPTHPAAYPIEWQIVIMGPERHLGYAIQWFALALTLLILFAALNRSRPV